MSDSTEDPAHQIAHVAVDIGGTFTDIVVTARDGAVHRAKTLSTPPDFERAVIEGLAGLARDQGLDLGTCATVAHGTTVATNAILEGRGACTAVVTTKGFRDVLELGRMRRPSLYDVFWEKPVPLVPRRRRLELDHRIAADGSVERAGTPEDLAAVAEELRRMDVESVAVCLLNSYRNPDEERRVAEHLSTLLDDRYVSVSVDILPEIKEYERTSTTVVNAYVRPVVDRYVEELRTGLSGIGIDAPLRIMHSAGGLLDADRARRFPVQMIESGPAAGVIATRALMRRLDIADAIAFDMGGTTAKASVLEGGEPFEAPEYEVGGGMNTSHGLTGGGGYTIRVPAIDIAEVGAGGGSIVWVDRGGAPRVGPRSAGASPGPACYGLGGIDPTVTDALMLLGYLNPRSIAGGTQHVDRALAETAMGNRVADSLGLSTLEAAYGACRIAIANMSKAIKAVTSERGRDPRNFVLVGFGGAGPAFVASMAAEFGIETAIVPVNSGLFSAVGLHVAEVQYHDVRSYPGRAQLDAGTTKALLEQMEADMRTRLEGEGDDSEGVVLERFADMRYAGQSAELRIPVPSGQLADAEIERLRAAFDDEHERTYGHRGHDQAVELVNLRIRATCLDGNGERSGHAVLDGGLAAAGDDGPAGPVTREAYFGPEHGLLPTPVLTRETVGSVEMAGPLIVEDMDATTVIPPGSRIRRDVAGNLIITNS